MKNRSTAFVYLKVLLISSLAGIVTFFLISLFFTRIFSWRLVLHSVIFGPVIGSMIGFSCALIGEPISRRLEAIPKPFNTISQALTFFVVSLLAATLFFFLMVKLGFMAGMSTKLLLTFLMIAAGIGVAVTLVMTIYEHLNSELEKSYEKIKEKELLEKELQLARQVQAGFLPLQDIRIHGFEVSTFFRPAKEVGGDYFDFITVKNGVGIAIADVSGKGVPASLVMTNLHATLHALAEDYSPTELLNRINKSILKNTAPRIFVTFFYGILDNSTGKLEYINAGHNPPLLIRQNGMVEELAQHSMGLGISPDARFQTGSVTLSSRDTLLLYTDGLTEAGIPHVKPWGEEKLKHFASTIFKESTDRMVELIIQKVEESVKGVQQTDDIALVLLKRN